MSCTDLEAAELSSSTLTARVEALGARMTSIRHGSTAVELLARHDTRVLEAADRPALPDGHLRFADGWNVLIPNAGDSRVIDGVEHEYHGEAARRVWQLSVSANAVTASLALRSLPLSLTRTTSLVGDSLLVRQTIRNDSDVPQRFAWVEHPVFDGALLSGGGAVRVGASSVPLVQLGQGGFDSARVPAGCACVELPDARLALRLHWDPHVLPHMHVWQERRSILGPPWFGRVDGVGLEPASHGPGDPEFGLGPLTLEPFGTLESLLRLEVIEAERGESPQPVEAAQ